MSVRAAPGQRPSAKSFRVGVNAPHGARCSPIVSLQFHLIGHTHHEIERQQAQDDNDEALKIHSVLLDSIFNNLWIY